MPDASTTAPTVLPVDQALRRIGADRELLAREVRQRSARDLTARHTVRGGPLGDFCESLRDLVAHVLMWDEINAAVLSAARAGRSHWSLEARWESPDAGRMLNRAGVAAGRELPVDLVVHRFAAARETLLAEVASCGDRWTDAVAVDHPSASSIGGLAQHVMTVPGADPYLHAAGHLGLPVDTGSALGGGE